MEARDIDQGAPLWLHLQREEVRADGDKQGCHGGLGEDRISGG